MKIIIDDYLEQKINIKENISFKKKIIRNYIIQKINIESSKNNG